MSEETNVETMKDAMRTMMQAARSQCDWMLDGLSHEAHTDAQRALQVLHGTPYEFGQGCIAALDMISPREAKDAIDKYVAEWNAAG